jgi:hypothetical protein
MNRNTNTDNQKYYDNNWLNMFFDVFIHFYVYVWWIIKIILKMLRKKMIDWLLWLFENETETKILIVEIVRIRMKRKWLVFVNRIQKRFLTKNSAIYRVSAHDYRFDISRLIANFLAISRTWICRTINLWIKGKKQLWIIMKYNKIWLISIYYDKSFWIVMSEGLRYLTQIFKVLYSSFNVTRCKRILDDLLMVICLGSFIW